ncbi:MAG: glycosyltransferase family 4 protein [Candidatus Aminicenantes bacterium]|nr:glycosyltransferase family 4 protein [Candidatus Aminicenantes bacterium]
MFGFYKALANLENYEVTVIVPKKIILEKVYASKGVLFLDKILTKNEYKLIPIPLISPEDYSKGFHLYKLWRAIKTINPDIIHVLDEPFSNTVFQVALGKSLKLFNQPLLFYAFGNQPYRFGKKQFLSALCLYKHIQGGGVSSEEGVEHLRNVPFAKKWKIEKIYWGIDCEIYRPISDKSTLKKKLKLSFPYIIGFVGRFVPEKGLKVLLQALPPIPEEVHLVMLGEGPMKKDIYQMSSLLKIGDRVHILPPKPWSKVPLYLNCMDVLVLPSLTTSKWKEQFGRILPEAMACTTPVIGSNSAAIPEVIGSAGLIVREGDPTELKRAICKIIFDRELKKEFEIKGLERVNKYFSIEVFVHNLHRFYHHFLSDKNV